MSDRERISVVALLTASELSRLGLGFERAWPIDETPCFQGLLEAIDDADRQFWRDRDGATVAIAQDKIDVIRPRQR